MTKFHFYCLYGLCCFILHKLEVGFLSRAWFWLGFVSFLSAFVWAWKYSNEDVK